MPADKPGSRGVSTFTPGIFATPSFNCELSAAIRSAMRWRPMR
jgi:hypothetical protein